MQDNKTPKDINEILDDISSDADKNSETLATEFIFETTETREPESGLVFDDSGEEDEPEKELPPPPKVKFETEAPKQEKSTEFSLPDKFEVNKKYDTKTTPEESPKIITTYVPTFTEVSENYRMKDDPRPRTQTPVKVSDDATREFKDDIDPTAEIDENVAIDSASPITQSAKEEASESVSKVFKFSDNEVPKEEKREAEVPIVETVVEKSEKIETVEEEPIAEEKQFVIPDPEEKEAPLPAERRVSTGLEERMVLVNAPDDIGKKLTAKERKKSGEYISYAKRDTYKDKYLDTIMSVRVRFFVAAAITLLLLVMEIVFAAGVNIPELLNLVTVPGAVALLDMQFALCLFIISLPETVKSVKSLLKKQIIPELYLPFAFAVLAVYTVAAVIYSPASYPIFGILFAVSALAAIGSTYRKINADFEAFKLVSVNGEKKIIDTQPTRNLESENDALDGAVEEHKSVIMRMFRTLFVSDFFGVSSRCAEKSANVLTMLASSFGIGAVAALVAYFVPGGGINSLAALSMVFMTAFPLISIAALKVPYYHASLEAVSEKSALIGEAALFECAEVDVVTFEDTEVFGDEDVTLQRIMLYGRNENLSKALRQMSALFIKVGGPLHVLFSSSLDRKCPPANSVEVFSDGLLGEIDGVSVAGGNLKFMRDHGIKLPKEEENGERVSDTVRVLYAAENGEVYAKFYIRYSFSEEFSMILPMLEDEKIKVLVYTRNPGIDNKLMRTLTAGADRIRVMRKAEPMSRDTALYNKISAIAVTSGDKMNSINAILTAKKYATLETRLVATERIAMLVGGVLAFVLSIGGMFVIPPLVLAAWQAAGCIALHIISRKTFPKKSKKGK